MPPKPIIPPIRISKPLTVHGSANPRFRQNRNQKATPKSARPIRKSLLAPLSNGRYEGQNKGQNKHGKFLLGRFESVNEVDELRDPLFLLHEQSELMKELVILRSEVNGLKSRYDEMVKSKYNSDSFNVDIAKKYGKPEDAESQEKIMEYSPKVTFLQNQLTDLEKVLTENSSFYSKDSVTQSTFSQNSQKFFPKILRAKPENIFGKVSKPFLYIHIRVPI